MKAKRHVTRSVVRDRPGHPVAAPCTISHCQMFDLIRALEVILATVRGDEKSECWTIREYLDAQRVYHEDLQSADRLIEAVCGLFLDEPA